MIKRTTLRFTLIVNNIKLGQSKLFGPSTGFHNRHVQLFQKSREVHDAGHDGKGSVSDYQKPKQNQKKKTRPAVSEVLTSYLRQANYPPWTSYFVKYESIVDDHWGKSHFNCTIEDKHNYHILRTGCYPYIKYHCTKRPFQDLTVDDKFFRFIKVLNLGIPCLAYGIAAKFLLTRPQAHTERVLTSNSEVIIYFLYKEDKGSMY